MGFVAFFVGLFPFDEHPSVTNVIVEGVVYYVGVAVVEEFYVRGLLLNLIKKVFKKRRTIEVNKYYCGCRLCKRK